MGRIVINTALCKGCYLCVEACRKKHIEIDDKLNVLECYPVREVPNTECTACPRCATVCPETAIEVFHD